MSGTDNVLRPTPEGDTRLLIALDRINAIANDMSEMRAAITRLSDAYAKMAVMEERQTSDRHAMARAFSEIEKVSSRLQLLEAVQPIQKQSSDYVQKGFLAIVIASLSAIGGAMYGANRGPINQIPMPPAVVGKQ